MRGYCRRRSSGMSRQAGVWCGSCLSIPSTPYPYLIKIIYMHKFNGTSPSLPFNGKKNQNNVNNVGIISYVFLIAHNIAHRKWRSHLRNIPLGAKRQSHTTHVPEKPICRRSPELACKSAVVFRFFPTTKKRPFFTLHPHTRILLKQLSCSPTRSSSSSLS